MRGVPFGRLRSLEKGKEIAASSPEKKILFIPGERESDPDPIIEAKDHTRTDQIILRSLVLLSLASLILFVYFFFRKELIGYKPLFYLLSISIGYKLLKVLFEWYHYWAISKPPKKVAKREWTVDMLTTAMPGEPYELIKETLEAMVAVRYPHTTYLCDEGNDPKFKALCKELGAVHVTREKKINAKAGNINNALKTATGEICVILDPDHKPLPEFLDEVLPYFEDEKVGYVQIVQSYKNAGESFVARGAAEQTYTFYGPMMMGMHSYGTAQAIGANCTFRRAALDSIGGHAAGLSEDMHTAMQLQAKGWEAVYNPKILAKGLVPSNISAYYQQQIKWSRGTFELLFMVFPKLFSRFTWRQKIHHLLVPLHFAAGIIGLIDITIPIAALFTGQTPVLIEFSKAYLYFLPLFLFMVLTRQYAQKWLLEKHERGFHLSGGILLFGTWWIMLIGFIYTLFRVKVPYIPTPKDNEYKNNIALSLPNIGVCLVSFIAIIYGLGRDWNPYNFLMAGYALMNAALLGIVIFASQDLLIVNTKRKLKKFHGFKRVYTYSRELFSMTAFGTYGFLRKRAPLLAILFVGILSFLAFKQFNREEVWETPIDKYAGGFYTGVYMPQVQETNSLQAVKSFQNSLGANVSIISLYEFWGTGSLQKFPAKLMEQIARNGSIPMITWLPWQSPFQSDTAGSQAMIEKKVMKAIVEGEFDDYIKAFALKIRAYNKPVFIRFAPESDNPAHPWSTNIPEEFIGAWRKTVDAFNAAGATNVAWVWNPWSVNNVDNFIPGTNYVDWIGVNGLSNSSTSTNQERRSFEQAYQPFHKKLPFYHKPVMLTEFGFNGYDTDVNKWMSGAFSAISEKYQEIKSLVFYNTSKSGTQMAGGNASFKASFAGLPIVDHDQMAHAFKQLADSTVLWPVNQNKIMKPAPALRKSSMISGKPGSFTLMVNGKPFYIKGIAYNPEHGWRDGFYPLNRRTLERDFKSIKDMGANTIRRYNPTPYDKNILTIAEEYDLKVLYGIWFDPKIDYFKDSAQVEKYMKLVDKTVSKYKDAKAILAWNIGNEASGLLKDHFRQPYLSIVRKAYMDMIERMAQRIHQLDPSRPVFTSLEHAPHLEGEIYNYRQYAPSVDIMGINSYYKQRIGYLYNILQTFDSTRPYLVSEFGPKGYWDQNFSDFDYNKIVTEASDKEKALLYMNEWNEDIEKHRGANIGGVAYCWKDRYEGTATWYGINDYKRRKKHVYYALQKLWTKNKNDLNMPGLFILGPHFKLKPGGTYEFTAVCDDPSIDKFEWHLLKENYLEEAGEIKPTGESNKVKITLPEKGAKYRLYVYTQYKNKSRVITANKSIYLYTGIHNKDL